MIEALLNASVAWVEAEIEVGIFMSRPPESRCYSVATEAQIFQP